MTVVAYADWNEPLFWIERGSGPWPRIQAEAADTARMVSDGMGRSRYEGIVKGVRVSDEREEVHMDPADCDGCCRTIDAHQFSVIEP